MAPPPPHPPTNNKDHCGSRGWRHLGLVPDATMIFVISGGVRAGRCGGLGEGKLPRQSFLRAIVGILFDGWR